MTVNLMRKCSPVDMGRRPWQPWRQSDSAFGAGRTAKADKATERGGHRVNRGNTVLLNVRKKASGARVDSAFCCVGIVL